MGGEPERMAFKQCAGRVVWSYDSLDLSATIDTPEALSWRALGLRIAATSTALFAPH